MYQIKDNRNGAIKGRFYKFLDAAQVAGILDRAAGELCHSVIKVRY